MTNTDRLNQIINESGYKRTFIAKALGISRQQLAAKIDNKYEFTAKEISALSAMLQIKNKDEIFFVQ